jgi:hypothetical protein
MAGQKAADLAWFDCTSLRVTGRGASKMKLDTWFVSNHPTSATRRPPPSLLLFFHRPKPAGQNLDIAAHLAVAVQRQSGGPG